MRHTLVELRACWWLARRLRRDYPEDGWWDAWRTARLLRRIRLEIVQARPLTDAEQFELEVELWLARLPVVDGVAL